MNINQLNNLINFTLLFTNPMNVLDCSISYIWEKYNYMIGFKPTSKIDIDKNNKDCIDLKFKWLKKWNIKSLDVNKEKALNYLIVVTCVIRDNDLSIKEFTPDDMILYFEEYVGSTNEISNSIYTHVHPSSLKFFGLYKEHFKREMNIITTLSERGSIAG